MHTDRSPGDAIAQFRIERRIGAGGMGIVYRAEDTRLRRPVALKVMRPEQVADERRRARFLREARTAAGLVHPNIAAVYEVGEDQGAIFIAMELVHGESLRAVLERGQVSVADAKRWATDVARALARAHESGVVHRDLKPDNVMIAPDGGVKLLDFGIAKALSPESGSGDPALDATAEPTAMTAEGVLVGTPEYMSPEQARGARLDVRSDVFSFGTVLFEMLVGHTPFRRGNVIETAAAITRDAAPRVGALRPEVPAELEAIVARCLEKTPSARYADGAELLAALQDGAKSGSLRSPLSITLGEHVASARPPVTRRRRRTATAIALGAVSAVVLAAGAGLVALRARHAPPPSAPASESARAPIASAPPTYVQRVVGGGRENNHWLVAVTADGSRVAYDDGTGVWLQELPRGAPTPLAVPEADVGDVMTIDFVGRERIVYSVARRARHATELWSIDVGGGAPHLVREDAFEVEAGGVSPDGKRVVYATATSVHLGAVDATSTLPRLFSIGERERVMSFTWSPESDAFAYLTGKPQDHRRRIAVASADGAQLRDVLAADDLMGTYGSTGLAFAARDRLLVLRYQQGNHARLAELTLGEGGAPTGAERVLARWEGDTITELRAGGARVLFGRANPNGALARWTLAPGGARVEGEGRVLAESAWSLRPIGFIDDTHVAVIELRAEGYRVASVSTTTGALAPYVDGPLSTAFLVPGGDVLYWTRADAGPCTLMRHVAADGTERPAPMAGTTCNKPIHCVAARCIAVAEGEDLTLSFRAWDPERGATGAPLASRAGPVGDTALSSDGRFVVATSMRPNLTVIDLAHEGAAREIVTHAPETPQWVAFGPDASVVYAGFGTHGRSDFAIASASPAGKESTLVTDPVRWTFAVRVARDGRSFVAGRRNVGQHMWMLEPQ